MRVGRALLSSLVVLRVVGPAPAYASGTLATAKPWHYWLSFLMAASFVGLLFMLLLGYVVQVVMPKDMIPKWCRTGIQCGHWLEAISSMWAFS